MNGDVTHKHIHELGEILLSLSDDQFYDLVSIRLNTVLSKASMKMKRYDDCNEDKELWTLNYLADECFLRIASTKEDIKYAGQKLTVNKYYNQAFRLWKWIPVAKPIPEFVINISDLPQRMFLELKSLDKFSYNYVVKQVVGRLFENINTRYYHQSIAKNLKVRLDL